MENYFYNFRKNIIGIDQNIITPFGEKKLIYTDWTASGRLYKPIEDKLINNFYKFVANTHSESTSTGTAMTYAYHKAQEIIKKHVNANSEDVIITTGTGMTGAVNKFQRILGLRLPEQLKSYIHIDEKDKPVVFITHMEHHSNQTSWLETIADVVILDKDENGLVRIESLAEELEKYQDRALKIGSFTACSNVTGIQVPVHKLAEIMHNYGGYCFVDFAASAPYVNINMHPENDSQRLDAIFFSPHKFLGGPGSSGVLIFNSALYNCKIPDHPGGGTVKWTNPWGERSYISDIELREDGGTPGFLQAIRTAAAIGLKNEMGVENITIREEQILNLIFPELRKVDNLQILAGHIENRLPVISFYVNNIHFNLIVKLLNDLFGIQSRGGCSCAGTYGHYLLNLDYDKSRLMSTQVEQGYLWERPGWVRVSFHPTTTNDEVFQVIDAIKYIIKNISNLENQYKYNKNTNEYHHINGKNYERIMVDEWFNN